MTDIQYTRQGQGEPLLLLHGLGSERRAWRPVLDLLAQHYDVINVDLPGFGTSPPLPHPPSPQALAQAVAGLLDRLALRDAHVVGNSLGGWVALELGRLGRARSIVALSPAGFGEGLEKHAAVAYLRVLRVATPWLPRAWLNQAWVRKLAMRRLFGRPEQVPLEDVLSALDAFTGAPGFAATVAAAVAAVRFEGTIACPVTIAWGERDLLLPVHQAERAVQRLPGARLVRMPGLGHAPMWDDPQLVTAVIRAGIA